MYKIARISVELIDHQIRRGDVIRTKRIRDDRPDVECVPGRGARYHTPTGEWSVIDLYILHLNHGRGWQVHARGCRQAVKQHTKLQP